MKNAMRLAMRTKWIFLMAALLPIASSPTWPQNTRNGILEETKKYEELTKLEEEKLKTIDPEIVLGVFLNDKDLTFRNSYEFCLYAEKEKLSPKSTEANRLKFERVEGRQTFIFSYRKHVAVYSDTTTDVLDTGATILFQILTKPSLLENEEGFSGTPLDGNYERIMHYREARWILRDQWLLLPEKIKNRINAAYVLSISPRTYGDGTIWARVWFD
jgi:hypothetical protein